MNLEFVKNNETNSWECEFSTPSDFNLHIEGVKAKDITLYQRTAGTKYSAVRDFPKSAPLAEVIDDDFPAAVYPKSIKVVCATEPTMAVVTTNA